MKFRNQNITKVHKLRQHLVMSDPIFPSPTILSAIWNSYPHPASCTYSLMKFMAKLNSLSLLINCQFVEKVTLKYVLELEKLCPSSLDCIVLHAQLSKLSSQLTSIKKNPCLPSYAFLWLNMCRTEIRCSIEKDIGKLMI